MSSEPELREVDARGLRMRLAVAGEGPLVLLCHGWPEGWRSWRHQLKALAEAGFRAVAPDMRGYGGSDAPAAVDAYTMLHLVGDVAGVVEALGDTEAVIVGHDWGAAVAWHAALLKPEVFRAVVGMSVPYAPPGDRSLPEVLRKLGLTNFYIQYFQEEGRAERELDLDPEDALARIYLAASARAPEGAGFAIVPAEGLLARAPRPDRLDWLDEATLREMAEDFRRSGFRGGLNWYRNLDRNRDLLTAWRGQPILQPSLFIAGQSDAVLKFPGSRSAMDAHPRTLPGLQGDMLIEGGGHWVQQERPHEVNALLLKFLRALA